MQPVPRGGGATRDSVAQASAEIDARSFGEVLGRTGQLGDPKAERVCLDQNLVVEDEVVRVALIGNALQDLASISAKAGVVLRQLLPDDDVLEQRERPVGHVLV